MSRYMTEISFTSLDTSFQMTYNLSEVNEKMTRIKQLRKIFGYTQEKLANLLSVSRSAVAMWETSSQTPDYETLRRISSIFDIPSDFIISAGIFSKWDDIIKYYDDVSCAIINAIPSTLELPSFCGDKYLVAWLDTRLYDNFDELQLARWFAFAVRDIDITPIISDKSKTEAEVSVEFTPEFLTLIDAEKKKERGHDGAKRIPILGNVAAGIPIEAIEDIIDWEEIPESMCAGGKEYFGLQVKGDSMYPDYLEGDTVIVRKTPCCDSGDVCVVYVNGYDATLKQLRLGDDGSVTLLPRNPAYPPRTYTKEEVQSLPVSIAGVVVELRRKVKK